MRAYVWGVVAAVMLALAPAGRAQETPSPEQLKKMYDDAVGQLKAAQERKNQLAADNDKLNAQVEDLKRQLSQSQGQIDDLKRIDAEHAEKTFFLRSHYAAWQAFLRQYPEMMARWKSFIGADFLTPDKNMPHVDKDWPMSVEG